MKKLKISVASLLMFCALNAQNVAINSTGAVGNSSAILDLSSTTTGFLVPRMSDAQMLAISTPMEGLLVYNNDFGSFMFNDSVWITMLSGRSGWTSFGNNLQGSPAIPATYGSSAPGINDGWIGTKNSSDFMLGANNKERFRISQSTGNIGIGTASPTEMLHVFQNNDAHKSTIYSAVSQTSTTVDYNNRAIVGSARGANATWGYAVGVSGIANQANSWAAIGVYAGLSGSLPTGIGGDQALYADGANVGFAGIFMGGKVGIGTASPDASAILDISSTSKGFLVPRMTTSQMNAISTPMEGLLLYNTTDASFFYNDSIWIPLLSDRSGWATFGNNLQASPAIPATYGVTAPGINDSWIGTKNPSDFMLGANNKERFRISQSNGNIGIGTASPTEMLHVFQNNDVTKNTIYCQSSQASVATQYQNRAIVGQSKGGNGSFGYAIGVTGIGEQANSNFATGVFAGLSNVLPASIGTDQALYADGASLGSAGVFMGGGVSIGLTAPDLTTLHVRKTSGSPNSVLKLGNGNQPGLEWFFDVDGTSALFLMNENNGSANNFMTFDQSGGSVAFGTGSLPNSKALVDLVSTTKGLLLPRMTKVQRDAIANPPAGLIIYQNDNTPGLRCFNGTNWMRYTETAD